MKITDLIKKVFPKPRIPQKRYLAVFGMLLYVCLKFYVDYTGTEWDNRALETGKQIVLEYFADEDSQADPFDGDGLQYGERE